MSEQSKVPTCSLQHVLAVREGCFSPRRLWPEKAAQRSRGNQGPVSAPSASDKLRHALADAAPNAPLPRRHETRKLEPVSEPAPPQHRSHSKRIPQNGTAMSYLQDQAMAAAGYKKSGKDQEAVSRQGAEERRLLGEPRRRRHRRAQGSVQAEEGRRHHPPGLAAEDPLARRVHEHAHEHVSQILGGRNQGRLRCPEPLR